DMKRWAKVALMAATLLWATTAQATTPAGWKDTGFSINADGMKLRDVLNEFGTAYGVQVSSSIKDQGVLKGRLKAESGSAFLDRMMHTYNFRWFVYRGTLYIVPRNDNVSVRLEVGEDAVQDAKAAMMGVGLFDSRFGWGELPDEGIVLVNGPREYVNLAREVLLPETIKKSFKGKQIMVFRLKYASASDRVITTRGEKETIPGIKNILSGLLGQEAGQKASDDRDKFDATSGKRSRAGKYGKGDADYTGNSRSASGRKQNDDEEAGGGARSSKSTTPTHEDRPRIDVDSALNAIIIYDSASKREMYESLIAELDVEPQQVEIEAVIVDIERSKLTDLGVEWGVTSGNTSATVNGTQSDSNGINLPIPGATMLISNAARFYARLKAMESKGDAHVLAKPTVLTLDNVAAVLDLSQTAYVPLVGERVADLADVTAGTKLRVVPRVIRDGEITRVRLEVDIEDGSLGDQGVKSNVTRSTISTQAIIDTQQTLMIGGYHSESKSQNRQKVPLLGDIPFFGALFSSTNESESNRERLFLITPRLSGTTGVEAAKRSDAVKRASELVQAEKDKLPKSAPADKQLAQQVDKAPASAPANKESAQQVVRKHTCIRPKPKYEMGTLNGMPG
ncbi:MAG: type III secretion system outer membrane ring subunit SctC, partial [Burkholderiaceae bacterium]